MNGTSALPSSPLDPHAPQQFAGYRNDCRYFNGEKPCKWKCEGGCQHFAPFDTRILIIKLGATGDVLRTTPLLRALRAKFPTAHITWLVEPISAPLLKNNPLIDKILVPGFDTLARLQVEKYDLLFCLDKVDAATAVAMQVQAREKRGFGMSDDGNLAIFNPQAQEAMILGLSDDWKFRHNQKPYQQIVFEAVGFPFQRERYVLELEPASRERARNWAQERHLNGPLIGLNTGAGTGFAGKAWRTASWAQLARRATTELGALVLLLGGPSEREKNREIAALAGECALDSGTENSLPDFCALVDLCDAVVTGDTTGMHIAIALEKPVVVLFGSTCPQEIDLYGRGEKLVAPVDCAPCYLKKCPIGEVCMDALTVEDVFEALKRQMAEGQTDSSSWKTPSP